MLARAVGSERTCATSPVAGIWTPGPTIRSAPSTTSFGCSDPLPWASTTTEATPPPELPSRADRGPRLSYAFAHSIHLRNGEWTARPRRVNNALTAGVFARSLPITKSARVSMHVGMCAPNWGEAGRRRLPKGTRRPWMRTPRPCCIRARSAKSPSTATASDSGTRLTETTRVRRSPSPCCADTKRSRERRQAARRTEPRARRHLAEILFVDDSDDSTPAVIEAEASRLAGTLPTRLLRRERGQRPVVSRARSWPDSGWPAVAGFASWTATFSTRLQLFRACYTLLKTKARLSSSRAGTR